MSDDAATTTEHAERITGERDHLWREWVLENLGRDSARASAATEAAIKASLAGMSFSASADAARAAWGDPAREASGEPSASAAPPVSLVAAMIIAIGGAAISAAVCVWFFTQSMCDIGLCGFIGSIAAIFFLLNAAVVAVNWWLLLAMRRRSRAAWKVAVTLVALGSVVDLVGQMTGWLAVVNLGAFYIAATIDPTLHSPLVFLSFWWLIVQMLVIQVPILALLLAPSTRQWCNQPRAHRPQEAPDAATSLTDV